MFKTKIKFKKNGFTLVELLVTLGIMMLLMGITIPFEVSYRNKAELKGSVKALRSLFWEAQNRSLAPSSTAVTSYKIAIQKTPDNYGSSITISLQECKGVLPCPAITGAKTPQVILGKNIIIEDISFEGGNSPLSSTQSVQTDFAVGDNSRAGKIAFTAFGGNTDPGNIMKIKIGSLAYPSLTYDIIVDKKMESITYQAE
jgi:prepilin-type N-terminal cleavage/methylation domain-containing protein